MSEYNKMMDKIKLDENVKDKIKGLYSSIEENKEADFVKTQSNKFKKFFWKPLVGAAVCVAAVVAVFGVKNIGMTEEIVNKKGGNTSNVYVMASELKNGEELVITDLAGYGLNGGDDGVMFDLYSEMKVEGDNIKSVAYHIDEGNLIAIIDKQDVNKLVGEGEEMIGSLVYDRDKYIQYGYKDVTVDYSDGAPDMVGFNIENRWSYEECEGIYDDDLETQKAVLDNLIKDMEITITIIYNDGEVETEHVKLGTVITSFRELGEEYDNEEEGNTKHVLFTTLCE
ncbi:MAG: hypothetical protein E7242_07335 [Lachnospiraceae bacterium]|nr:hypothetical protein [Lachnospiraceae bacterium]